MKFFINPFSEKSKHKNIKVTTFYVTAHKTHLDFFYNLRPITINGKSQK